MKTFGELYESLWANIHKKRQRIKRGSGEKMRKKGEKGAPTDDQIKRAQEEIEEGKLVASNREIVKKILDDIYKKIEKELSKNKEKGIALINTLGAFVGHMPKHLTHPDEDRYLTLRECLSIMKLPKDFELQGGVRNLNHICQNVPVTTAEDMAVHVEKFVDGRLSNQLLSTDFLIQDNTNHKLNFEKNSVQLDAFMV